MLVKSEQTGDMRVTRRHPLCQVNYRDSHDNEADTNLACAPTRRADISLSWHIYSIWSVQEMEAFFDESNYKMLLRYLFVIRTGKRLLGDERAEAKRCTKKGVQLRRPVVKKHWQLSNISFLEM